MVNSLPQGKVTVTHGGTDYELDWQSLDVILVENGMAQAVISTVNREVFQDRVDIGDNLKVELRYLDEGTSWRQVFGGWIFDLAPTLTMAGEMMTLTARDYGLGLAAMLVGSQYGSESENTSLNTVSEVLTDMIPNWVEKVLHTGTNSGYSFNITKVAPVASNFRYLYWAYRPALNCINDMIDLISAANAPNAGAHWIVVSSGTTAYLCLAIVGAHETPSPADIWPSWFNIDQADSTIEVGKDMIVTRFTKQRSDANYILYHGEFRKPVDGDKWTEQTPMSSYWFGTNCTINSASGADYVKVGSNSLWAQPDEAVTGSWRYPYNSDASWNLSAIGGKFNIPSLNFYIRIDSNIENPLNVTCLTSTGNYYQYDLEQDLSDQNGSLINNQFFHINIPVGPYAKQAKTTQKLWSINGSPSWSNITCIIFKAKSKSGQTGSVFIDGLHFAGWILRGARDDTKIGTQKARVKLVMDDVAKDDSTSATDDAYVMAQLAKAELYRAITTPIIGEISIPGTPQIMGGQLAHIHHGKKSNGTFSIDKNMRIIQARHRVEPSPHGFRTYLTLTDDVTNSRALMPNVGYNLLVKAANPEFLNRETASRKTREIDLSQTILSRNYST